MIVDFIAAAFDVVPKGLVVLAILFGPIAVDELLLRRRETRRVVRRFAGVYEPIRPEALGQSVGAAPKSRPMLGKAHGSDD